MLAEPTMYSVHKTMLMRFSATRTGLLWLFRLLMFRGFFIDYIIITQLQLSTPNTTTFNGKLNNMQNMTQLVLSRFQLVQLQNSYTSSLFKCYFTLRTCGAWMYLIHLAPNENEFVHTHINYTTRNCSLFTLIF